MELGRQHDVVASPARERFGDDLLRFALPVDVGGVDEVDTGVKRRMDDADGLVVVGIAPGAEHHRAETELADRYAGATEWAMLHGTIMPEQHYRERLAAAVHPRCRVS